MENHSDIKVKTVFNGNSYQIDEGFEQIENPMSIPGFKQTTNFNPRYAADQEHKKKKSLIAKVFSNLSRLGMDYDEQVVQNMRAIPADPNLVDKQYKLLNGDLFNSLGSSWKVKSDRDKNFFEKYYGLKREALRNLALQPELEDILDTMTNESIVYDSNYAYFAEPFIDVKDMSGFSKKT